MAICSWCDQEMTTAETCSVRTWHQRGTAFSADVHRRRRGRCDMGDRCGDCGVAVGGAHHPGCDLAVCPVCRGQMMTCGCRFDEDGVDLDLVDE